MSDHVASARAEPLLEPPWTRWIETVAQSLQGRLGAAVDLERIRAEVQAEFAIFSGSRVRDFVPILVETRVRSRLLAESREHGAHQRRPAPRLSTRGFLALDLSAMCGMTLLTIHLGGFGV